MTLLKKALGILNILAWGAALAALGSLTSGCSLGFDSLQEDPGVGGGRDTVTINMPFTAGYQSQCVQGVGDDYSHDYTSTYFDLDLDTPNDVDDSVFAPISGTAYVHESTDGFGTHINIDLGDGTYIVLGHLSETLIEHGEPVAAGQLIALEGTTGDSTGDHVHIGRHEGEADEDASDGTSIDGLSINVHDSATGADTTLSVHEFTCGLYDGHVYTSQLATPLWHPDGSLIKTPTDAKVYLLSDGAAHHVDNEDVFWSYNFDFDDVMIIDDEELDCYGSGDSIVHETDIRGAYDGDVWLLVGSEDDDDRYAKRVRHTDWQTTLKSWGIIASTHDDLDDEHVLHDYPQHSDYATFRDGTIVTEASTSDVYFVADGVAMPIYDYDTFLMLDLYGRELMQVDDGTVEIVQEKVGDCATDSSCLHATSVTTCGGPEATFTAAGGNDDHQDDEEEEEVPDDESEPSEEEEDEDPQEDPDDEDTGDTPEEDESCELTISWEVPYSATAATITLEVEIEQDGDSYSGWDIESSVTDAQSISDTFELDDDDTKARANITFQYEDGGSDYWGCTSTSSSEDDDELVGTWSAHVTCDSDTESIDVDVYHKTSGVVDGCEAEMVW